MSSVFRYRALRQDILYFSIGFHSEGLSQLVTFFATLQQSCCKGWLRGNLVSFFVAFITKHTLHITPLKVIIRCGCPRTSMFIHSKPLKETIHMLQPQLTHQQIIRVKTRFFQYQQYTILSYCSPEARIIVPRPSFSAKFYYVLHKLTAGHVYNTRMEIHILFSAYIEAKIYICTFFNPFLTISLKIVLSKKVWFLKHS